MSNNSMFIDCECPKCGKLAGITDTATFAVVPAVGRAKAFRSMIAS